MNTNPSEDRLYFKHRLGLAGTYLLLSALFAAAVTHAVAGYTFTSLVDTTGAFSDFGPSYSASLNASGCVAFRAALDDGRNGVFRANGTTVTTITTSAETFASYSDPVINQAGTVVFWAQDGPALTQKIMTGSGGPLVTIADTTGQFREVYGNPSINAAGTVAFNGILRAGGSSIFVSNSAVTTPTGILASTSTINDAGTMAFQGYLNGHYLIGASNGGPTTIIAVDSGPLKVFGRKPAINNSGTVAFVAGIGDIDAGAYGIYSGNGGALTTIADLAGPFSYFDLFYGEPSINGTGTVAFFAGLDAGGYGVFTGDGVTTNEIIGLGDMLFGSPITGFGISPTALNDSGQLAFYYSLANGTSGLALATPTPEPSASLLLAAGALLALRRRR